MNEMNETTNLEDSLYPETAADALAKWDANESIFSVEMGGLGPGYEMAIQGLAFEMIRDLQGIDWAADDAPDRAQEITDATVSRCNALPWGGFSGAQVGAAANIACITSRKGYRAAITDPAVKDRLIQVCKKDLRA